MINQLLAIKKSIYIRQFEYFLLELYSRGKISGTVHTCIGQELTPVVISSFIKPGDMVFSNHRGHGHFISVSDDHVGLLAEILGKKSGVSGGMGGSQHLYAANFISNGIQGGLAPVAVGWGYSQRLKQNDNIAVCYIGDGTLGEGQLYESFILSKIASSQTLFVLENNGYAQSTSIKQTHAGSLKERINGFGLQHLKTNIWDFDHLVETTSKAISLVRKGVCTVLEIECYRLLSHSKGDDNRQKEEIKKYWAQDIVTIFSKEFPDEYLSIKERCDQDIDIMYNLIKDGDELTEVTCYEGIYNDERKLINYKIEGRPSKKINSLVYDGLDYLIKSSDGVLIGEDIQGITEFTSVEYGGAFKVTKDLSERYPGRVLNSSISEAGIVGFSIGVSLAGQRGICEIMFGDFMTLAFDQILQQASKIPTMYGANIDLPLIVRTPMGGRRGYGPTHSQCIEKHLLFLPNITIIALNILLDPMCIIQNIAKCISLPTVIIEDKVDYTKNIINSLPMGYTMEVYDDDFPTCIIRPSEQTSTLLIHVYGGQVSEVLGAIDKIIYEDIFPTLIVPLKISPYNINPLIMELSLVKNLMFIEEGSKFAALSSEIISTLTEMQVDFNLICRYSNDSIVPCNKIAESNMVPNSLSIYQKIISVY